MSHLNCPGTTMEDSELTGWLRENGADEDAVSQFLAEDSTLVDALYYDVSNDWKDLRLSGGMLCILWKAIVDFPNKCARLLLTEPSVETLNITTGLLLSLREQN